jgi:hypothetical protein
MDRTWQLFTQAACARDRRVRGQVIAQQEGRASRSGAFDRLEPDDGDGSCPPATPASPHVTTTA